MGLVDVIEERTTKGELGPHEVGSNYFSIVREQDTADYVVSVYGEVPPDFEQQCQAKFPGLRSFKVEHADRRRMEIPA